MAEDADKRESGAGTATAEPETKPEQKRTTDQKKNPRKLPPYNVVLLDDNDHTYEYVMEMLMSLFGYQPEKGFLLADEVNRNGRVIVLTTTKEHAELKRDQIHAYGTDTRVATCKGSMSAIIEPAEGG